MSPTISTLFSLLLSSLLLAGDLLDPVLEVEPSLSSPFRRGDFLGFFPPLLVMFSFAVIAARLRGVVLVRGDYVG